ncbi:efflux RND transporter permease subunit [Carboxylicivirga marina]|uniref:efflux RND transporter permease subunit n=1 Tax=Carboxylicivirga marina TaxID=2800988 RepID=UPI0025914AAE|nr:efflux RND transporter permease subunit [uncultured Carboxylicivirga sp.]
MRSISRFSVNYPVTVLMIVLGIILLGGISLSRLGTDLFPDLQNPRIYAEIISGERSPEEIEKRFVEQVEALAVRQSGVLNVSSVSRVGAAIVTVEYDWGKDIDEAFLDLQKALTPVSQNEDVEELNISRFDPNASPVIKAAFSHNEVDDMNALRKVAENYIRNELIRIEGIADIRISGEENAEVMVVADPHLLDVNNLTTTSLLNTINNFNQNVSGGSIEEMGQRYIIKGLSSLSALHDVENLVVKLNQNGTEDIQQGASQATSTETSPVLLKDVAVVKLQNREPESIVRINGQRCLGISIYKETRFNTVAAVEKLEEAFTGIQQRLPGYQLQVVNNQGAFIQSAIGEVQESALLGIILAVFVLFIFLRRFGVTLIISLAIPVSIIATFNLMYFNGLTLNIMTLGGLALGAGMLVDNAIVVVENIVRKIEEGLPVKQAAIEGTSEVGGALTASTLTTIVVFLPIVYLHGASGELFKDQAWTVAFSLLSSLVVALLVIPVLSKYVFKGSERKTPVNKPTETGFKAYHRFLTRVLNNRAYILVGALCIIAVTAWILPRVGSEFMPEVQSNEVTIETVFPAGTSLNKTDATLIQMEQMVMDAFGDKLKWIYTHAGPETSGETTSTSEQGENTGFIKLVLKDEVHASFTQVVAVLNELFGSVSGLEMRFVQEQSAIQTLLGNDEAPLVIEIEDNNSDNLEESAILVTESIRQNTEIYNVKSSFEDGAPEVNVVIDRIRAGIFNLDVSSIMSNLSNYLSSKDGGSMEINGDLTDITLETPDVRLNELADLKISQGDKDVLLSEVATISIGQAPREVLRNNQKRVIRISAMVTDSRPFDHFAADLEQSIQQLNINPTSTVSILGEEEKRKEAFGSLQFALILSIILVYMVMASQFESLLHPFTILLTIPLAGVGAVWAFYILGHTFNIMAYIGIVMLAGIAVNDSIILVDAINQYKKGGMSLKEAVIAAGQQRVRPILMTSLTTILALVPLTFGFGDSASLRAPMAIAVIGGLVTSTLLTLVVIPCVYFVFDRLFNRTK